MVKSCQRLEPLENPREREPLLTAAELKWLAGVPLYVARTAAKGVWRVVRMVTKHEV